MSIESQFKRLLFKKKATRLTGYLESRELIYAQMFSEGLRALNVQKAPFYPIGGAANYSLLYILLRVVSELNPSSILEFGIGQSTLLLSALNVNFTSVEHDEIWIELMKNRVDGNYVHAPLRRREFRNHVALSYDYIPNCKFDFVIVDGPQGANRKSRWGVLPILEAALNDEFIVVFDDVDRKGEQDTALELIKMRGAHSHLITGTSSQCLVFTDRFMAANWY